MNSGFPSMTALLGLLAVAGYQNRDKIAEYLGSGAQSPVPGGGVAPTGQAPQPGTQGGGQGGGLAGMLEGLGNNLRGATPGGILSGGLGELINRFKQNGQAETADSWVGHGPNKAIAPPELERAIGPDVLDTLSQQTGLSRQELLARLSRELPDAVDKYTPEGRLPPPA
jgi:uncharacterized protein YidB (DUF937 family)